MTVTVADKKDTRTIEFWVVEWDGMNRSKVLQPKSPTITKSPTAKTGFCGYSTWTRTTTSIRLSQKSTTI